MLTNITLKNFALAASADVDFTAGFNVITGETGAGKSLLLQALGLCAGARSDASMVRFGADKAQIFCTFDLSGSSNAADWLAKQDIIDDAQDFEELLIRRQIADTGRSKAWVNGAPVGITQLKELGAHLLHMHSQHAQQALLKPAYIIDWYDKVAGTHQLVNAAKHAKQTYDALVKKKRAAAQDNAARLARIALLTSQLDDVEALGDIDYDALEAEHETLSNFEAIARAAGQIIGLLDGTDGLGGGEVSANALIANALRIASSETDTTFAAVCEHLTLASERLQDAIGALSKFSDMDAPDAGKLALLDRQMADFHRLAKKYGIKPNELNQQAQMWQSELDELEALSDEKSDDAAVAKAQQILLLSIEKLQDARKTKAAKLKQDFLKLLKPLSLPEAQIEFFFEECAFKECNEPPKAQLTSQLDKTSQQPVAIELPTLIMKFSANKGMALNPVHTQASGGELSRLALVMQVMNAAEQDGALLVFDEVDVGISGATAQIIGKLLRKLGDTRQILAITHQAQVAASAHHHLLVTKNHTGEQTTSSILSVSDTARTQELARMAGGEHITQETLAHAQTLLDAVQN